MIVEVDCVRALQGDKFVGIGLCVAFIVEVDSVRPLQGDKFVDKGGNPFETSQTKQQKNRQQKTDNRKTDNKTSPQLPHQKSIQLTLWIMIPTSYFGKRNFSLFA